MDISHTKPAVKGVKSKTSIFHHDLSKLGPRISRFSKMINKYYDYDILIHDTHFMSNLLFKIIHILVSRVLLLSVQRVFYVLKK